MQPGDEIEGVTLFILCLAMGTKRPITNAILGTFIGAGCLVGFFATVWPML